MTFLRWSAALFAGAATAALASNAVGQAPTARAVAKPPAANPASPAPAAAVQAEPLLSAVTKPVRRRGTVQALGSTQTQIAGRKIKVADLAADVFVEHRATAAKLRANKAALLGDPVTTEELLETDDAVYLIATTSVVVVDPSRLPAGDAALKALRRKKTPKSTGFGGLDAEQLANLRELRKKLGSAPANDPLKAAATSDQALFDALADGKGPLTITETVAVPKASMKSASGMILLPSVTNGFFDFGKRTEKKPKFGNEGGTNRSFAPKTESSDFEAKFLAGSSDGLAFDWEKIWEGSTWRIRLNAELSNAAGIRAPIKLTGKMEPTKFTKCAAQDQAHTFKTTVTGAPFDAPASFYSEMGLSSGKVFEGKEMALEIGASVRLRVKVFGKKIVDESVGKHADLGFHFAPPVGNGTFTWWIPPNEIGTKLSIPGVVAEAKAGFLFYGEGTITSTFEVLQGETVVPSTIGTTAAASSSVALEDPGRSVSISAVLPALPDTGETAFGGKFSNVGYQFEGNMKLGVAGSVTVDVAGLGGEWSFEHWGGRHATSMNLEPHAGTPGSAKFMPGVQKFQRGSGPGGACTARALPNPTR